MKFLFSFIIPVYNRPTEIEELLASLLNVYDIDKCEIVIIEDGSTLSCEPAIERFNSQLNINYYYKPNTGPGDSRNYGMKRSKSKFFIILDSDVMLPPDYIINLKNNLDKQEVHCYGGPDKAHGSFSSIQKAINFSMTSILTTGGVRGKESHKRNFQPRSFNMGLSKKAFQQTGGFSNIHPGEDPDLALRLLQLGFNTTLFTNCYVYHKRRINWNGFAQQVYKFGLVRPILNSWHPESHNITYYFPSLFSLGFVLSILLLIFNSIWLFVVYVIYFIVILVSALMKEKSLSIALLSVFAVIIQFFGYGTAFLKSFVLVNLMNKNPKTVYPFLFFKV